MRARVEYRGRLPTAGEWSAMRERMDEAGVDVVRLEIEAPDGEKMRAALHGWTSNGPAMFVWTALPSGGE